MRTILAVNMETGDLADYEPKGERRRMNQKQIERAAGVRDDMDARATKRARHMAYMETTRIQDIEFVKMLRNAVAEQTERITELEQQVTLLRITANLDAVAIRKLRGCIEGLEQEAALGKEQWLQVVTTMQP